MRAAMCVIVRDLVVFGVLTDMMRGRPAIYATFASYDEVAHHSGLQRADTLEALRKLDQQFGQHRASPPVRAQAVRDRRALRPRPDAGRDLQAAQRLRPRRPRGAVAVAGRGRRPHGRRRAGRDGRTRRQRGDRAQEGQARQERRVGPRRGRARLRQPRPDLPDGGEAAADARGDRRAPPRADPGVAQPPARRVAARPLGRARRRRHRARRARTTSRRAGSRGWTRSRPSLRPRPTTCCAPTASSTSPTSWSAASTTPTSTRAAPSRS